eukprot:1609261-Amphidinium_carterae.2
MPSCSLVSGLRVVVLTEPLDRRLTILSDDFNLMVMEVIDKLTVSVKQSTLDFIRNVLYLLDLPQSVHDSMTGIGFSRSTSGVSEIPITLPVESVRAKCVPHLAAAIEVGCRTRCGRMSSCLAIRRCTVGMFVVLVDAYPEAVLERFDNIKILRKCIHTNVHVHTLTCLHVCMCLWSRISQSMTSWAPGNCFVGRSPSHSTCEGLCAFSSQHQHPQ